jgi:hypothetical protein
MNETTTTRTSTKNSAKPNDDGCDLDPATRTQEQKEKYKVHPETLSLYTSWRPNQGGCGTARTRGHTDKHGTARHGNSWHGPPWHGTARPSTARTSMARHGTGQHGTVWHGTARHGKARHGTARHGMAQTRQSIVRWTKYAMAAGHDAAVFTDFQMFCTCRCDKATKTEVL